MKKLSLILISLCLWSCSEGQVEEFAFRKTMEYSLVGLCGEEDQACINAIEAQISGCLEKSRWQDYVNSEDSEEELNRFTEEFYSCFIDEEGKPYFLID